MGMCCTSKTHSALGLSKCSAPHIDWVTALNRGLGKPCEICADQTQIATHATPCCHSACEACWAAWRSDRCMFCTTKLSVVPARAPYTVLPRTSRERSQMGKPDKLEAHVHRAVEQLVLVKQQLSRAERDLLRLLEEVKDCCIEPQARRSVLEVDVACFRRLVDRLGSINWDGCTSKLQLACELVESARAGGWSVEAQRRCHSLLQLQQKGNSTVWDGQWQSISALSSEVLVQLLPDALRCLCEARAGIEPLQMILLITQLQKDAQTAAAELYDLTKRLNSASASLLGKIKNPPLLDSTETDGGFMTPRSPDGGFMTPRSPSELMGNGYEYTLIDVFNNNLRCAVAAS